MPSIIHKDGVLLNGRRYNHPALQHHLYEVATVQPLNPTQVLVIIDDVQICIADVQDAISLADIEPQAGDRVQFKGDVFDKKAPVFGTVFEFDGVEWLIVIDNDDDYPHGFNRDDFDVIAGEHHAG